MINKKQNQLIGMITLILIAAIISPYIFTDKTQNSSASVSISFTNQDNQENSLASYNGAIMDNDDDANQIQIQQNENTNDSPQVTTYPDTQVQSTDTTENTANNNEKNYVIQLAALKNKQKIEELVALLRLNNYDVKTDPAQFSQHSDQVVRLLVGSYPSKEQAELVIIDLLNLTKLTGIVVSK